MTVQANSTRAGRCAAAVGGTALAALLTLLLLASAPRPSAALAPGEVLNTLMGETIDGKQVELAVFRSYRILVVDFWASWSPPSIEQHFRLREAMDGIAGVVWVSVSLDRDVETARAIFAKEGGVKPAIRVCDGKSFDGLWASAFAVEMAPSIYIIDLDGIVRERLDAVTDSFNQQIAGARRPPRQGDSAAAGAQLALKRPETAEINKLAPDFSVRDVTADNRVMNLSDFDNKVVMVVLFASWNDPSTNYLREVSDLWEKTRAYGFEMIGVSIETDDKSVRRWMEKSAQRVRFPICVERADDPSSITFRKYPFDKDLPWAFLIGKNGVVRDIGNLSIGRVRQVLVEDLNVRL